MLSVALLTTCLMPTGASISDERRREMAALIPAFELPNQEQLVHTALTGIVVGPDKDRGYDEFFVGELRFAFFKGTNSLAYCLGSPSIDLAGSQPLPDEVFRIKAANAALALKSLPRESPKLTVTRSKLNETPATVSVDVTVMIGQRSCDNGALFEYDAKSGRLLSVRADRPLDHSRYRDTPIVGEAQALAAAIDAYSRWKPFPSGVITHGPLLRSGVQNPGSGGDCAVEVTPSVTQEWRSGIARPYWLVQFASAPGGGRHQRVCVDAITGKAQVIDLFIALRANPIVISLLHGSEAFETSGAKGQAKRVDAAKSIGDLVVIRRGDNLLVAVFDSNRNLLFLPQDGRSSTYKVDDYFGKSITEDLARRRKLGLFGANQ